MTGRRITAHLTTMADADYDIFFGQKGKNRQTIGKGKGRTTSPVGKDGTVMKCFVKCPAGGECGSTEHLAKDCPHNPKGKSGAKGKSSSSHVHATYSDNLDEVYVDHLAHVTMQTTQMDMFRKTVNLHSDLTKKDGKTNHSRKRRPTLSS